MRGSGTHFLFLVLLWYKQVNGAIIRYGTSRVDDTSLNSRQIEIEIFVGKPPTMEKVFLDFESSTSQCMQSHRRSIQETSLEMMPIDFAGRSFELSNQVSDFSGKKSPQQLGINQKSEVWRRVDNVAFDSDFVFFGTEKECLHEIDSFHSLGESLTTKCLDYPVSRGENLCALNAEISTDANILLLKNVSLVFFTKRLILPRKLEATFRSLFYQALADESSLPIIEIVVIDQGKLFRIRCDSTCYSSRNNPFSPPILWIDFVDEMIVGMTVSMFDRTAMIYNPSKEMVTLIEIDSVSTVRHWFEFFTLMLCAVIVVYRLTHHHTMLTEKQTNVKTSNPYYFESIVLRNVYFERQYDDCHKMFGVTDIKWSVIFVIIYLDIGPQSFCIVYLTSVFVFIHVVCFYRQSFFANGGALVRHCIEQDVLFQCIMSVLFRTNTFHVLLVVSVFQSILLWDNAIGAMYAYSSLEKKKKSFSFHHLMFFAHTRLHHHIFFDFILHT